MHFFRPLWILLTALFLTTSMASATTSSELQSQARLTYERLTNSLQTLQQPRGHWDGAIDADPSADALVLLLGQRLGFLTPELREEIFARIFDWQAQSAGTPSGDVRDGKLWAAYPSGPPSLDTTGVILFALEASGVPRNDTRVVEAWQWFEAQGGAPKVNLASRTILAMAGVLAPESVAFLSTKFFALPASAPVSIHNIGVGRTVVVPLAVWMHYQKICEFGLICSPLDAKRVRSGGDLFGKPLHGLPTLTDGLNAMKTVLKTLFAKKPESSEWTAERRMGKGLRLADKLVPASPDFWAQEGLGWLLKRQQRDGTWGGLLQISAGSMLALAEAQKAGAADFSRELRAAWEGLIGWRRETSDGRKQQQITQGPVMDTARILTAYASAPENLRRLQRPNAEQAVRWLLGQQIFTPGDWTGSAPDVRPGGWAFQYHNTYYPDIDDTAMVVEALARSGLATEVPGTIASMRAGLDWILGLQNKDGGFPVWDRGTSTVFNTFASIAASGVLGARAPRIADTSQIDVTSRVLRALTALRDSGLDEFADVGRHVDRVARFLIDRRQSLPGEDLPVWEGDWMTNYLYGTSEVVDALFASRHWTAADAEPYVRWLLSKQDRLSGGWGESNLSYSERRYIKGEPTLSQSLMVLNALISYVKNGGASDVRAPIEQGLGFVLTKIGEQAFPKEAEYTGIYTKDLWFGRYDLLPHYEAVRVLGKYLALPPAQDCEGLLLGGKPNGPKP